MITEIMVMMMTLLCGLAMMGIVAGVFVCNRTRRDASADDVSIMIIYDFNWVPATYTLLFMHCLSDPFVFFKFCFLLSA